jgi:hypothetical protein
MRKLLTIVAMLTVAPITAVTALVCYAPDRWGGSFNPLNILVMSVFGLFTVPLWPTYIPAVVLTPWLMSGVSSHRWFVEYPLWLVLLFSCLAGTALGLCVFSPLLLMSSHDKTTFVNWALAGAVSGAVTLAVISCIYRFVRPESEPSASPNGGPATPPPITSAPGGPRSVS